MRHTETAELVDALARVGRLWMRHLQDVVDHPALTPARLQLLAALSTEGPQIMQQLATVLGSTPRNVTALVDGLEREGLVARTPHATDRRATVVSLTDAGEELTGSWAADYEARAGAVFAALSARDQRTFLRLLGRLETALLEPS